MDYLCRPHVYGLLGPYTLRLLRVCQSDSGMHLFQLMRGWLQGNAEPGAVLRGAKVDEPDGGVRAHQHAAGADLRDGGGAEDGVGAPRHGGGAGQAGGHGGVRGRLHGDPLLQGPRTRPVGVTDPLALRGGALHRGGAVVRRRRWPRGGRRARGRAHHRQLRRLGRLVHPPHQDVRGLLRALHQHRHHVPHGRRAVRRRQRRHGPQPRRLEARMRHQALLRALHRKPFSIIYIYIYIYI